MRRALYAITIFASAFLLFAVEPMVGKAMLPRLGGVPAAWTACLLFFQAALLVGYGYVWIGSKLLGPRARVILHVALLALPLIALVPFARMEGPSAPSPEASPIGWALLFAAMNVGVPFAILSATGPLLSHWYGLVDRRPYFLYAASNAGSFGALLAYPFAIEPWLDLSAQAHIFRIAFGVVATGIAAAGFLAWRAAPSATTPTAPPTWSIRARWVALAFVPAILLAGASNHITIDLAPVPLLWVVPLAIYLLSFVAAFSDRIPVPSPWIARGACLVGVVLVVSTVTHANEPAWLLALMNLLFLGAASWIAHRRLADSAPDASHLPEFYTLIALGGVLGTFVSAVIAPAIFPDLWEYPAAIALACMTREVSGVVRADRPWRSDLPHIAVTLVLSLGALLIAPLLGIRDQFLALASFGPAALYSYRWMPLRRRFTLCLLALIVVGTLWQDYGERRLMTRSFFGVLRVVDQPALGKRHLRNGTTLHGTQELAARDRCEPLGYYHRQGPLGWLFDAHRARGRSGRTFSIGLGAGSVACYAVRDEPWRMVEINPDVARLAQDPHWFTYLRESPSDRLEVVLGDGRVVLAQERDRSLALIVVDAFNSDSVPVHLLTREALRLYLSKLEDGGWAALHLSNRVLDLRAVVADVVRAEHAAARLGENGEATWVVVARRDRDLDALDARWQPLQGGDRHRAWTDSFSSLFGVLAR